MIKKPADELVVRLAKVHDYGLQDVLQDYLNEYAEFGWDSICTELSNIMAQVDLVMTELKFARISN